MATKLNSGAERVSRRNKQTVNKAQADKDAQLIPPAKGPEKDAAVAQANARQLARFGGDGRSPRKIAQTANRQRADAEAGAVPVADENVLTGVAPGQTPTLRQLRLLAKQTQRPLEEEAHEVGREAGRMVKDVILNRRGAVPRSVMRHRRVDQAMRQLNTANATS